MLNIDKMRAERNKKYSVSVRDAEATRATIEIWRGKAAEYMQRWGELKGQAKRPWRSKINEAEAAIKLLREQGLKNAPPRPLDPADVYTDILNVLQRCVEDYEKEKIAFLERANISPAWAIECRIEEVVIAQQIMTRALNVLASIESKFPNDVSVITKFFSAVEALEEVYVLRVEERLRPYAPNLRSSSMFQNALTYTQFIADGRFLRTLEGILIHADWAYPAVQVWMEVNDAKLQTDKEAS